MSKYQCNICNKIFAKKNHLDNHLNKKNKCQPSVVIPHETAQFPQKTSQFPQKPAQQNGSNATQTIHNEKLSVQNNIQIIDTNNVLPQNDNNDEYQCNYCHKTFARKDNAHRHIKQYCLIAKQQNQDKQDIFDKLMALEE